MAWIDDGDAAPRLNHPAPSSAEVLGVPRHVRHGPVYRLMAAVLEVAIADRIALLRIGRWGKGRLEEALLRWFRSSEDRETFAFESICTHLDLDAAAIRRRLGI